MKRLTLIALLLCFGMATRSFGREANYHVQVHMTDVKDSLIYLVHYYGKNRPTIFISDSMRLDSKGNATFVGNDSTFVGGIYIILLGDKERTNFEFLLNKGDNMTITATKSKLPDGIVFKNSPENERFLDYIAYLKGYADKQEKLKEKLKVATSTADTDAVRKQSIADTKVLTAYRRDYVKAHPHSLLANVFSAMEVPEVPEGPHMLEDGVTKDSTFAYHYYKAHYWDGWDFKDDRLIYTPLYDAKIEEYMG